MKSKETKKKNQEVNLPFSTTEFIQNALKSRIENAMLDFVATFIEKEVKNLCGEKYTRNSNAEYVRYGFDPHAFAYLFGQKVPIHKQRVRQKDACEEVKLENYEAFHDPKLLNDEVMKCLLNGVSTRNFNEVIQKISGGTGLSKSKVSEAFIESSQKDLDEMNHRDLGSETFFAMFIDGIEFQGESLIVALGVDSSGRKKILGLRSGSSENHQVVSDLLHNLISRNLKLEEKVLFVLDGSKALKKGVKKVFGSKAIIVRCWKHKVSNIEKYIPKNHVSELWYRMKKMIGFESYEDAIKEYKSLKKWLEGISMHAVESLEEAGDDLLVLQMIGCPHQLRKSLYTTNSIESLFSVVRSKTERVKRWRKGENMTERWFATIGLKHESEKMRKILGVSLIPSFLVKLNNFVIDKEKKVA